MKFNKLEYCYSAHALFTSNMATVLKSQPDVCVTKVIRTSKTKDESKQAVKYPCGCHKWVEIHHDKISEYDIPNCVRCRKHGKLLVYRHPFFVHDEMGEYECPDGNCPGNVRFLCIMCNNFMAKLSS
jgi:hypothetical protein